MPADGHAPAQPLKHHSPVLGAENVQQVGVRVDALYRHLAGRVAGLRLHDAEAVDASHLGCRLPAAQPGEKPVHLVRQVICGRQTEFIYEYIYSHFIRNSSDYI